MSAGRSCSSSANSAAPIPPSSIRTGRSGNSSLASSGQMVCPDRAGPDNNSPASSIVPASRGRTAFPGQPGQPPLPAAPNREGQQQPGSPQRPGTPARAGQPQQPGSPNQPGVPPRAGQPP